MSDYYSEYAVSAGRDLFGTREYETIYLGGTIEISVIHNKSRRKKKLQFEMKDVTGIHIGPKKGAAHLGKITKDFSSGKNAPDCCVMKINGKNSTQIVCFEPGEELIAILRNLYRQYLIS